MAKNAANGEILSEKMLAKMVEQGILDRKALDKARKSVTGDHTLTEYLLDLGVLDGMKYLTFLSDYFHYPIINPEDFKIQPDVLHLVPSELIERYKIIPIACHNESLTIAVSNPGDLLVIDDLHSITKKNITPVIALPKAIQQAIEKHCKNTAPEDQTSVEELIAEATQKGSESQLSSTELVRMAAETPVIKITNALIAEAIRRKASDLFIEPWNTNMRVRCRVDGLLEEIKAPPRSLADAIVSRIKIMSNLNIAERRMPQDGRVRIKAFERMIDVRVSVIPSSFGEKVCLRILDVSTHHQALEHLGFHPDELKHIRNAAQKPYGMILVTGPTGCGKSTTLYSVLKLLHKPSKNITTVEDPVEYKVDGINQVQVHDEIGLTFPAALRSILRQDPDIIMLGEIRDHDTLDIAIKAALTGHLVLSTLHTNDAASSIIRMTNMGLEPFLITASVLMVSAQRLVRKLCLQCREPYTPPSALVQELHLPAERKYTFYKPTECNLCRHTGYSGRSVITEVLALTPEINKLIVGEATADIIKSTARRDGMTTLRESGVRKVVAGVTSLEEIYRVTMPDPNIGKILEP